MASAPDFPWIVMAVNSSMEPTEFAMRSATRAGCLEWILERRLEGDELPFIIYLADSTHSFVKENRIVWERPQ